MTSQKGGDFNTGGLWELLIFCRI